MAPDAPDPINLPTTPEGYRQAWTIIEGTWSATTERARALPPAALTTRVDGEWSFVETLRHLVFATDSWVRRTIMNVHDAYHPWSLPHDEVDEDGIDVTPWGIDRSVQPSLDAVLPIRTSRLADVRGVVDALGPDDITRLCPPNPAPGWPPDTRLPVGECLDVAVREEWWHHGYVLRDLAVLERS